MDDPGVIADILVEDEAVVPVGTDIVVITSGHENYMAYIEKRRLETQDVEKAVDTDADLQEKHLSCLKAIRHLVKSEKLVMEKGIINIYICADLRS